MHIDRELKTKDPKHGLQKGSVVEYLLTVAYVLVKQSIENGENFLKLDVLNLVNKVIFVLRPKQARHRDLILAKFLCVYMSLNLAIDVEDDGLLAVPQVGLALFAYLRHFAQ